MTLLVVVLSTSAYAPRKRLLRTVFTRVLCDFWENFAGMFQLSSYECNFEGTKALRKKKQTLFVVFHFD